MRSTVEPSLKVMSWLPAGQLLLSAAPVHAHDPALDAPLPSLLEYLPLGIEHVLIGYDHLAFVLGLTLLARTRRVRLAAITGFTIAHSLSLSACVLGVLAPPTNWVEAAIAISIAYVALAHRADASGMQAVIVSLVFGFIHGFGFAGALEELGLPLQDTALALVLFNLGVEAGQLLALCLFVPALASLRRYTHGLLILRYGLFAFGLLLTVFRGLLIVSEAQAQNASSHRLLKPALLSQADGKGARHYDVRHASACRRLVSDHSFRCAGARRE